MPRRRRFIVQENGTGRPPLRSVLASCEMVPPAKLDNVIAAGSDEDEIRRRRENVTISKDVSNGILNYAFRFPATSPCTPLPPYRFPPRSTRRRPFSPVRSPSPFLSYCAPPSLSPTHPVTLSISLYLSNCLFLYTLPSLEQFTKQCVF